MAEDLRLKTARPLGLPVEFCTRINMETSASVDFIVKEVGTMHGHMDVNFFSFR